MIKTAFILQPSFMPVGELVPGATLYQEHQMGLMKGAVRGLGGGTEYNQGYVAWHHSSLSNVDNPLCANVPTPTVK